MINGNSLIAKGLNTYVNKLFMFIILNKCANISKNLFLLCYYIVCRLMFYLINFRIRL
jgi:hypothetical protein